MQENFRDIKEGLTNYVYIGTIILLLLGIFFIIFITSAVLKRRRLIEKQKKSEQEYQQAILQTQLEIQEQTLNAISQEIHDNIGQVLSLVKLNLNTLPVQDAGQEKLGKTTELVGKAITDLRNLSRSMHGDKVAELGLPEAIAGELKLLQNTGQFATELITTGSVYALGQQTEMVLFRMMQESMHNAIKHSRAKKMTVQLYYEPARFTLTISDDGIGFDPQTLRATQTGIGLSSMQNRATLIGAQLSIRSAAGSGTNIIIAVNTAAA